MAYSKAGIRKRSIFLKLGSILPKDGVGQPDAEKLISSLSFLSRLEGKGDLTTYLVVGQEREKTWGRIESACIAKFIQPENMLFASREYIESKDEFDRRRHLSNLEKDPQFVDEYFTQLAIIGLIESGKVMREEAVLVGNDLWFDGFYTMRFSGIDFVLVQERLNERNIPLRERLDGLNYISISEQDMGKVAEWAFPQNNLRMLQNYVMDRLSRELLKDVDFSGLAEKAGQKRSGG